MVGLVVKLIRLEREGIYVVACFVEFVSERSCDVLIEKKRYLHAYDSGRSSGPVMIFGSFLRLREAFDGVL